jgi:hypothetical protein
MSVYEIHSASKKLKSANPSTPKQATRKRQNARPILIPFNPMYCQKLHL